MVVGPHTNARSLRREDAFDRHLHEVAIELVLQAGATIRADLALDVYPVALTKLATHAVRDQVQRRLVHRAAVDCVQGTVFGMAVFLERMFEQNHEGRFTPRGWAEQQQQTPPDFGAGTGGLEIVGYPLECTVDAKQLVLEQMPMWFLGL